MLPTRILTGLVVTASAAIVLVACSGTSTGTGTGDGGASSSSSTSSGSSGTTSKLRNCPDPDSTCTPAQNDAYAQCFITKCDADLAACYGADYKNANFSGPCGTYFTCTEACACGDSVCRARCAQPTAACSTCIQGFASSCVAKCPAPTCASGGGTKTCADLAICCARIVDVATQNSCQSVRDSFAGNNAACNSAYASYAQYCP